MPTDSSRSAHIVGAWLVALVLALPVTRVVGQHSSSLTDYFQDYASARNFLKGRPVYRPLEQDLAEILGRPSAATIAANAHPPFSVLLSVPLAYASYAAAYDLWNLLGLAALGGAMAVLLAALKLDVEPLIWPIALVLWPPLWFHLIQGQLGLFLLLLLALAWKAGRDGRDISAGAMIGVAGALKLFPLLLLGYFVLRRRWQAVVFGVAAFLLANLLSLVVFGVETYREYFGVLRTLSRYESYCWNSSLPSFLARMMPAPFPTVATALLLITLAVSVYTARKTDFDQEFGIALIVALFVPSVTWQHSFVLLLIPLLVDFSRLSKASVRVRLALFTSWLLMAIPEPLVAQCSDLAQPRLIQAVGPLALNFYGLTLFLAVQFAFRRKPEANI